MENPKSEKTFVLVKPDGVRRGLTGEIIGRIEQRDLKIIALEMVWATKEQIDGHYPKDEKWINRLGEKTMATYEKYGYDVKEELGTDNTMEIGQKVRDWILKSMTSGPLVKMVIQGAHSVDMIRKLVGHTIPAMAEMGTIRGDFSVDSPALANKEKRSVENIVHASETPEEAQHEISYWFSPEDIHDYKKPGE